MEIDHSLTGLPTGVTVEDAATQFDRLQQKLEPLWLSIESFNQDEQTIFVVPSLSLETAATGLIVQADEERFLSLLLFLTQPRARIVYVASKAIHLSAIEYCLDLRRGPAFRAGPPNLRRHRRRRFAGKSARHFRAETALEE